MVMQGDFVCWKWHLEFATSFQNGMKEEMIEKSGDLVNCPFWFLYKIIHWKPGARKQVLSCNADYSLLFTIYVWTTGMIGVIFLPGNHPTSLAPSVVLQPDRNMLHGKKKHQHQPPTTVDNLHLQMDGKIPCFHHNWVTEAGEFQELEGYIDWSNMTASDRVLHSENRLKEPGSGKQTGSSVRLIVSRISKLGSIGPLGNDWAKALSLYIGNGGSGCSWPKKICSATSWDWRRKGLPG